MGKTAIHNPQGTIAIGLAALSLACGLITALLAIGVCVLYATLAFAVIAGMEDVHLTASQYSNQPHSTTTTTQVSYSAGL